ncbi:MAG: flagellar protein FliT [Candidatus Omnitrophica bacterium]|nr:flagellar protein FliT [Candidatus Omnitrophota bacterium]
MNEIVEQYNNLLDIILTQIKAVQCQQWDELQDLTNRKQQCLEFLVAREEALTDTEKQPLHDKVLPVVQQIVKEDARLNTLLRESKHHLDIEIKKVSSGKKNMGKISGLYGKKFTNNSAFNKQC